MERDGKQSKLPTNTAGSLISATNPKNFLTFDDALAALRNNSNLDGIGFALTPTGGLCCIDLDNCFDEGRLLTHAWKVLKDLGPTYVERSPSGQGLHAWAQASIGDGRRFKLPNGGEVEIYSQARFMTMTGRRFEVKGYPHHPQVEEKQAQINALIERLERGKNGASATPAPAQPSASAQPNPATREPQSPAAGGDWRNIALDFSPMTAEDMAIAGRVFASRGKEALALWEGDISGYPGPDGKPDHSAADQAFANFLAEETQDPRQICRIFSASKLADREKWQNRDDYPKRTIREALDYAEQNSASHDFAPYATSDDPHTYLADTARAAWGQQRARLAEAEQESREQAANALADAILANAQAATDRTEEPPPIRYIINPQLSDDTGVAFLVGPGGGGKSFQALIRCIAIASGRPIGKAHQTEVTAPALFFSLEDPPKVLQRRYFHTITAIEEHYGPFSAGELAALDANLYRLPVRGQMGALMELDGKGNPRPTNDYHAVRKIIERTRPVLVVLDTMSRALGVDEQSNNHAAQWIAALERILFDYPETIFMIVGHTGKPGKGNLEEKADDPLSLRGASAFAWNARAVENYTRASDRERKFLGMEADTEVFKLTLPKHNYTPNLDGPIFFWRDAHGVPIEIDAEALKNAKAQKAYEDAVRAVPTIAQAWEAKGHKLNKKKWERRLGEDLTDPAKPKPGPEQLAHDALTKHGITFDQVETAIAEAIRRGYVKTAEGERTAKTGPAPVVIELVELPPELDE